MSDGEEPAAVSVAALMQQLEEEVRQARRTRLVSRGGALEYRDRDTFAAVDALLRRALDERDPDALLLPEMMEDSSEWEPQLHLRLSSHRPVLGPAILFVKRRLLVPLTRWLYDYSRENFRRQARLNRTLIACIEELAIENARLRQQLSTPRPDAPGR